MKEKIVKVRKHFQKIKYLDMSDPWKPKLIVIHLKNKFPIGHIVYMEKDEQGIVRKLIDLTKKFGNIPMPEIKKSIKDIN